MFLPTIISLTSLPKIEFNPNNPVISVLLPLLKKATILHYNLHQNQKQLLLTFKTLYERLSPTGCTFCSQLEHPTFLEYHCNQNYW